MSEERLWRSTMRRDRASEERQRLVDWGLVMACSLAILVINTRPDIKTTRDPFWGHVIAQAGHFASHLVLGALAWRAATRTFRHHIGYWLAYGASVVHAVLDEWLQAYVPTRNANLEDVLTNIAGVSVGVAIMEAWRWRSERQTRRRHRRQGT